MKSILLPARILLASLLCLFAGLQVSCTSTSGIQPRDVRTLSTAATAVALSQTSTTDRPVLVTRLTSAAAALDVLATGEITPENVRAIVASVGSTRPEYVLLATVLADYLPTFTTGENAQSAKAVLTQISAGIRNAAAAYTVPPTG